MHWSPQLHQRSNSSSLKVFHKSKSYKIDLQIIQTKNKILKTKTHTEYAQITIVE